MTPLSSISPATEFMLDYTTANEHENITPSTARFLTLSCSQDRLSSHGAGVALLKMTTHPDKAREVVSLAAVSLCRERHIAPGLEKALLPLETRQHP